GMTQLFVSQANLVSLAITPTNPQIPIGTTLQLKATGSFSDNTTQDLTASVLWTSTDASVVTVNDTTSKGLATGVKVGATMITAKQGTVMAQDFVAVTTATLQSIAVTPPSATIAKGTTLALTATGI